MRTIIFKIAIIILLVIVALTAMFFGVTAIRYYYFRPIAIRGDSMEPTLREDTLHFMNMTATPEIGDVCVFFSPNSQEVDKMTANDFWRSMPIFGLKIAEKREIEMIAKRIVGIGGDRIQLKKEEKDGIEFIYLFRNGEKIQEDIVMLDRKSENQASKDYFESVNGEVCLVYETEEYVVPEGCYYLLGDNREKSVDSRNFGALPASSYVGKIRL